MIFLSELINFFADSSALYVLIPIFLKISKTLDLPDPIPPVNPIIFSMNLVYQ